MVKIIGHLLHPCMCEFWRIHAKSHNVILGGRGVGPFAHLLKKFMKLNDEPLVARVHLRFSCWYKILFISRFLILPYLYMYCF